MSLKIYSENDLEILSLTSFMYETINMKFFKKIKKIAKLLLFFFFPLEIEVNKFSSK